MALREWTGNESPVARTQKARGLIQLREENAPHLYGGRTPDFALVQTPDDLDQLIASWLAHCDGGDWATSERPLFCRPCPVRPRHGFVDSGPVSSPADLRELWAKAQAADPQAEMLVMHPIEASCSAIYTPTSVSFGPGNDGATAGENSHILFHGPPDNYTLEKLVSNKGIGKGEVPYVEIVYDEEGTAHVVQVRSGPEVSTEPDYIPFAVKVAEVVQPNGEDLIEWEKRAALFSPGTVVYHPGGNKASHYAIHCVHNKIPYVTTFEPKVGEVIEPTKEIPPLDVEKFFEGIMAGTSLDIPFDEAVQLMLFGLHTSAINSTPLSWKITGMAAMQCLRLGSAACLGEYRHHQRSRRLGRHQIFKNAFDDFFGYQKQMVTAYRSFHESRWRSGFGGPKWAECSHQNMFLWVEMLEFMKNPSAERARHTLNALNRAVNVAHNGGWLFNKFASGSMMDEAAAGLPAFFVKAVPTVFRAAPVNKFEAGWVRMRRPRVLKVVSEGKVRSLVHVKESHNYTNSGTKREPKPKLTGIKSIQGVMRDNILHLQFKLHGKSGYMTKNIQIQNHEVVHGLDHSAESWATSTPYIPLKFTEIKRSGFDWGQTVLTDTYGVLVINQAWQDAGELGITAQQLINQS